MAGIRTLNDLLTPSGVIVDNLDSTQRDDVSLFTGSVPITAPNYLKFVSVPPARPFVVLFDSFVVQRVTTTRRDQIAIHYTNGAPLVDVFNPGPETMTVTVQLPDTAPFYTSEGSGYLGDSMEYFRALYDRYFRASGATGSKDRQATGYVEWWSKGRVTRGYLLRYALDRQSVAMDVNELVFEMFVLESPAAALAPPERLI